MELALSLINCLNTAETISKVTIGETFIFRRQILVGLFPGVTQSLVEFGRRLMPNAMRQEFVSPVVTL